MTGKDTQHISVEAMRSYARGTLEEAERTRVDEELLDCEPCLALFMNVLENESRTEGAKERALPMQDLVAMEERVIAELVRSSESKPHMDSGTAVNASTVGSARTAAARRKSSANRPLLIQRPVVQYTIAASITLLLLASGAFAGFTQGLERLDESRVAMPSQADIDNAWKNRPSWSDQLVNRTGNWLDGIQASRFK